MAGSIDGLACQRCLETPCLYRGGWSHEAALTGIERRQFSDAQIAIDIDGAGGQAYRLYRAAFDRTPDKEGVGFWMAMMDGGVEAAAVASGFIPRLTALVLTSGSTHWLLVKPALLFSTVVARAQKMSHRLLELSVTASNTPPMLAAEVSNSVPHLEGFFFVAAARAKLAPVLGLRSPYLRLARSRLTVLYLSADYVAGYSCAEMRMSAR